MVDFCYIEWKNGEKFSENLGKYFCLNKKYYSQGATTGVFLWVSRRSTIEIIKTAERLRRAKRHTSPDVVFSELVKVTIPQEPFLYNDCKKEEL
ncbi:hypothetical protein AVEN_44613-1 [Araneus ventricosus]|uniref:Uncharacterized protein n=1 Tax=Araneus ventricosus TaxID=182803 RepID=A0A4Y2LCZ1_ARAVE|nr:hypothetical protein AVEN_44613-1 [Araneus ventricosus]